MNLSAGDIGVIVVCLLVGYWVVGAVMLWLKPKAAEKAEHGEPPPQVRPDDAPPPWNEVLGIHADATPQEIRDAYRSQVARYHPDKVASLGEEIRAVAEQMTQRITMAYQEGMRRHGVKQQDS